MARFYGEVNGSARTAATRQGRDRITGHIRGWHLGAEVTVFINEDGEDELVIRLTGGSKNPNQQEVIYTDTYGKTEKLVNVAQEIRIRLPKEPRIALDTEN